MTNLSWIFYQEIPEPHDVQELLINGEVAERAFRTVRDVAIYSLPYSSVHMWSTENAGMLDFTSEVELWTRAGNIKIQLKRDINIRTFERLLAEYIL